MQLRNLGNRLSGVGLAGLASVGLLVACNEHPVTFVQATGAIEIIVPETRGTAPKLDILWMIDNSGSMCQEQKLLRDNFEQFINVLGEINLDFHIAVTTTHMVTPEQYPFEPVSRPGYLQSTPQPVPGFDPSCYYNLDANGNLDPQAGMQPVIDNIRLAVSCTQDPSQWQQLLNPNIQDLRCAHHASFWGCESGSVRPREEFFPPQSAYRALPKVLKADAYRDNSGALDLERLRADFSCMSMVGTRGYGFEKGLISVVTAFSPELTGPGGPNEGFLRPDARTGVIFVSDENDCSHNGALNERSACGVAECTFDENDGVNLIPVDVLRDQMMANLSASKGINVSKGDVIVASIHGRNQIYSQPRPAVCEQGFDIPTSCESDLGKAYSGHRYDQFIREFPTFFPQPPQNNPQGALPGLICSNFGPALVGIANLFRSESGGCINDVFRCEAPGAWCPSDPYSGVQGTCTVYPNDPTKHYCDTGLQVRLKGDVGRLTNTGYCIPASIDQPDFRSGCVVEPSRYRMGACPGGPGLKLEWLDADSRFILEDLTIEVRYAMLPPEN
jgi:hypothetical protein